MPASEKPSTPPDRPLRPRSPVPAPQHTQTKRGDVLTAISDGLVALQKEFYGKGPTQAKSYYEDDLVVCILRGGFTRVEETLLNGGRGEAVLRQRREFQAMMRDRYEAVVEHATGRPVIAFMSGSQQDPDMLCEVFVLGAPQDRGADRP
ncbi:Na-translocating system protein MpsC family protein [Patulibacter minatonensis]|uniref:Na-translocating system protein MpsC family protein n=1 Tax=Patulibacter minatonensis TaxID=298163 RepID=UPI000478FEEE|nr:Na-translocating system protein MpsC family protein [Patulibacter minatonensis]